MENSLILNILRQVPLLKDLNEQDHTEIIKHITLQYFPVGYTLFNEGDSGDRLYIIKSGMVKIFHPSLPNEPLAMLGVNDFFGEMALFDDKPRSASAVIQEDSEIFFLERADFFELVLKNKEIAEKLSEEFMNRVRANTPSGGVNS